jgi:hypothetical protein
VTKKNGMMRSQEFIAMWDSLPKEEIEDATKYEIADIFWDAALEYELSTLFKIYSFLGETLAEIKLRPQVALNKIGSLMVGIKLRLAQEGIAVGPVTSSEAAGERTLPLDVQKRFEEFARSHSDIPKEFVELINKHFWDLL